MIARLIETIEIRKMTNDDLRQVIDIEKKSYDFPWSEAVIKDCLVNNYDCYVAGQDNIFWLHDFKDHQFRQSYSQSYNR